MHAGASALQKKLGHVFKNEALLLAALTHPSREKTSGGPSSYERLEFLGDRVLALIIAEWLWQVFPTQNEGQLAKRHASLVNRDILAAIAESLGMAEALQMVSPTDLERGRVNILSDALEAVLGAVWADGGEAVYPLLRDFVRMHWQEHLNEGGAAPQDAKSALQEWAQGQGLPLPVYTARIEGGPAHMPVYSVRVEVSGQEAVEASGGSKREAEKKAAALMLEKLK